MGKQDSKTKQKSKRDKESRDSDEFADIPWLDTLFGYLFGAVTLYILWQCYIRQGKWSILL